MIGWRNFPQTQILKKEITTSNKNVTGTGNRNATPTGNKIVTEIYTNINNTNNNNNKKKVDDDILEFYTFMFFS